MRKYINLFLLILSISFISCENFLEPEKENILTKEQLMYDPAYLEGLLLKAYYALPDDYNFETDIASDDAVSNDPNSLYRRMATGEWKSTNDPISQWTYAYENIYYINKFLDTYQLIEWSYDPNLTQEKRDLRSALHKKRLKGEAYGLRAWYKYRLLQYHGGKTEDGRLLGFPIIDNSITTSDDWKLPRNTFAACVTSILTDLDTAIANLPKTWVNSGNGDTDATSGARFENRLNGNTAKALKSRVALLAASPSFAASSGVSWTQAATIAGNLLADLGALYTKSATVYNHTFYKEKQNKEIIWNRAEVQKRTWEQNNFPPSLFGNGRTNPSQSLVDAFPMKNGYPISHPSSGYSADLPYRNRDNRFNEYIVYNTSSLKSTKINTYIGAPSDGINVLLTSTRTGYYLKKLMSESVNLTPGSTVSAGHTYTLARHTEVLLNYAEAANEAWGPDLDGSGSGYGTARSKIAELRLRAGITAPDPYLASLTTQEEFRNLIRNERRVSLCFEGFRFWDIRRWDDKTTLQAPVQAAYITQVDLTDTTWNYYIVEEREYSNDMIYGPIPYNETLKYNIEQNKGW